MKMNKSRLMATAAVVAVMGLAGCTGGSDTGGSVDGGGDNSETINKLMGVWEGPCLMVASGSTREDYIFNYNSVINDIKTFSGDDCEAEKITSSDPIEYAYTIGADTFDAEDYPSHEIDMTYNHTFTIFTMLNFNGPSLRIATDSSETPEAGKAPGDSPETRMNEMPEGVVYVNLSRVTEDEDEDESGDGVCEGEECDSDGDTGDCVEVVGGGLMCPSDS